MIFSSPPQFGQCPMSISNTRLSRPAQPHRAVARIARLALGGWRGLRGRLSLLQHLLRHHQRAQLGIRCQNIMEPNEVQPRPGHQRSQPLHELQRRHHQVRRAVAPRRLQLEHHLARGVDLYALVGKRRAGDVPAQLLQRLPIVGRAAHGGVQAEPADVSAEHLLEALLPGHGALNRQHLLASTRTEGDAVSARRGLQRPERAGFVRITAVVGHEGRPPLFDQHPSTGEQTHHAGDDLVQHRLQCFVSWRRGFDELRCPVNAAPVNAVQDQAV